MQKCKVIAEIGATHVGNIDRAQKLIDMAAYAGADYVKLQKRDPHVSTPEDMKSKPHPNEKFSYGKNYLEHRINLELSAKEHEKLKEHCDNDNIKYAVSVWDMPSAKQMVELEPDFIKIPSAHNMNWEIIDYLYTEYKGPIHISTGMRSNKEIEEIISRVVALDIKRTVIYHCVSEYPVPFDRMYLEQIPYIAARLKDLLGNQEQDISPVVGFSNHGYGIAADIAAYALGATWIERHFIDDRSFPHTDASFSLEFGGLQTLVRDLKAIHSALQLRCGITEEEHRQSEKLRG